jgi:pyruvate/2-oxoglutarate dehydrogenase complex dihydrolipoamide acyltransferase (E2) component
VANSFKMLARNHYLSTSVGLIKEWRARDVVTFSELIDFTAIDGERARRKQRGLIVPSYTAFIVHVVASALREHPKLNRMVYRGLMGYRWVQFEHVDVGVAVELVEDGLDIAYASILRDADTLGLDGIAGALENLASHPADDLQLKRLRRMPPALTAFLARATRLHPYLWTRFRGASCAVTSPAKYGVEAISVKTCWPVQFAFGRVKERPMVIDGSCLPRRSAVLSMSWHRELTTGAVAARFFNDVVQRLAGFALPASDLATAVLVTDARITK